MEQGNQVRITPLPFYAETPKNHREQTQTDTLKADFLKISIENFNLKYKICEIKDLLELLQTQLDELKRLSNE